MRRTALTSFALAALFSALVMVLLRMMPPPLSSADYLMIGGAATLACMAALFVFLISTSLRNTDVFFRRRQDGC